MINDVNFFTERIIGCAINIHKQLGPGLLESVYQNAMCIEMRDNEVEFESQKQMPVFYKDINIGVFRVDFVVNEKIVVEIKSTERMDPVYNAQILSYMKLGKFKYGLLINFNNSLLKYGIKRFIL